MAETIYSTGISTEERSNSNYADKPFEISQKTLSAEKIVTNPLSKLLSVLRKFFDIITFHSFSSTKLEFEEEIVYIEGSGKGNPSENKQNSSLKPGPSKDVTPEATAISHNSKNNKESLLK